MDHTEVLRWLEARSDELRAEIAAAQRLPDRSHEVGDFKDEATDSLASTVSGAEVERDLAELRDNEHTLAIIRQGRYGLCEDCAEPIEAARLQARPASTRCLACQEAAERRPQAAGS
ncbi:hypothetical protein RD110_08635 [Rhodoferax koreense]|uniref:Zinc finger DksA/TraR C4-type domain-containing protein n=1 Tax=Rhodoferax koreensis TaxID=1842727 RepID=A0A1P8K3I3_9BURK|nr:hypothetical protein RD110_08635 [Rhodoferax koreense]